MIRVLPAPKPREERPLVVKLYVAKDVHEQIITSIPQATNVALSFLGLDGVPVFVNPWLEPGDAFAEMSDGSIQRVMKRVA